MISRKLSLLSAAVLLLPSAAQAQDEAMVEVEIVIATGVEDRQPMGEAEMFPVDVGMVYGWTRVSGAANTTIEHVWRHMDHEFVVPLEIGGSPWRVWTTKSIPEEWDGEWTFEVRDADGNVIDSTTFTIGAGM